MNTPKKLPLTCPSCDTPLKVSELFCNECGTKVCGEFDLPPLARLTEKEQQFVLDFIKSSGSLKDMARTMGLSYPPCATFSTTLSKNSDTSPPQTPKTPLS